MKLKRAFSVMLLLVLIVGVFSCAQADDLQPKAALAVSPKKKTVNVGDELQLSVNTDQPVAWSSGNPAKATVDQNGLVTAVRKGNVTITAMSENGKKAGCRLTIKQPMLELKLNKAQLGLAKGKKQKLKASFVPYDASDKKLSWSSSNKKVATVSKSGVVTGKSQGQALITAKSKNGLTAQCTVAVVKSSKVIKEYEYALPDYSTEPIGVQDLEVTLAGVRLPFPNVSRAQLQQMVPVRWVVDHFVYSDRPSTWAHDGVGINYYRVNPDMFRGWSILYSQRNFPEYYGRAFPKEDILVTRRGVRFGDTPEEVIAVYGTPTFTAYRSGGYGYTDDGIPTEEGSYEWFGFGYEVRLKGIFGYTFEFFFDSTSRQLAHFQAYDNDWHHK